MKLRIFTLPLLLLALSGTAQAATLEEAESGIADAEQLRAAEFAPVHFAAAKRSLADAKEMLAGKGDAAEIVKKLDEAVVEAKQAADVAQEFTTKFAKLVDSRDRMQMAGKDNLRADLADRAESDFAQVVTAFEDQNKSKAEKQAKFAEDTIHAAQVVAAREQFVRPITKAVAGARHVNARTYAPKALDSAVQTQKDLERLIQDNPDAQTQAYALSQRGERDALRSMRIAELGSNFVRDPAEVEKWYDNEHLRLEILADALGVKLSPDQTSEEQVAMLKQAVEDMKTSNKQQLADAASQISDLEGKLAKYEGELSGMDELRRKLQLKREAEAKIQRLSQLFDPSKVEILLTTDADVILRMKKLNFRSGSAVIPPEAYELLDNALQSIALFPDRQIRVEGHTDSVGSDTFNQTLSERRAQAVKEYLAERIDDKNATINAVGYGASKPIANNKTAEGRTQNRRIDIVLLAPKS